MRSHLQEPVGDIRIGADANDDVPYVLFIIVGVGAARHFRFERRPAQIAGWLLPLLMLLSLLASRTTDGVVVVLAAASGASLILAAKSYDEQDLGWMIALPLLLTTSFQGVIVIAQSITHRAIGLTWIKSTAHLTVIDGLLRVQGTMSHVYEPAALGLLAGGVALAVAPPSRRLRIVWVVGAALSGSLVGLTHSRAGLLSLILMAVFIVVAGRRGDRHVRVTGSAFLLGFLIAAIATASAWAYRGEHTATANLDDASLGRITLAKQAIQMAIDHPILGVGPGRYLPTMRESYTLDDRYPYTVHNVPLAIAAEDGIPAAVVITFLIGWGMWRAIRSGPRGGALAVCIVGFLLFDVLHYDRGVGLLMLGVWLAVLQHHDPQFPTSRPIRSE